MSSNNNKELIPLLLEFLEDENYTETVHMLEKESRVFFSMNYFEECLTNGDWDGAEDYLSGFTKLEENYYSFVTFFMIRRQRYLEALDRCDNAKAVDILQKDLKVFPDEIFNELAMLLRHENFGENEQLSKQGNTIFAREVKNLIAINHVFHDKLRYPSFEKSRLRTLLNQSLYWQHSLCTNRKEPPDIKTLFVDHYCPSQPAAAQHRQPLAGEMARQSSLQHHLVIAGPNGGLTAPNLNRSLPKAGGVPPIGIHGPSEPVAATQRAFLAGWMANLSSVPHQMVTAGPNGLTASNFARAERVFKRSRASGVLEEVNNRPANVLPITVPRYSTHMLYASGELPKIVIANFSQGSAVMSIDFHPRQQNLLLVGTRTGDITVWEVGSKQRLLSRSFKIWDVAACSATLPVSLVHASTASVTRAIWSPNGCHIGVAYSMHVVHVYSYHGRDDLRDHLEISSHVGIVTDLAFVGLNQKKCIISCGTDTIIKVWDVATGEKLYTYEGHGSPVFCVYPLIKQNIPVLMSADFDGKIMAWQYDKREPVFRYDTKGHSGTRIAYSMDRKRLFTCGTNFEGESVLMGWPNDDDGVVERVYNGLNKQAVGIVDFDVARNRFLVAGDESRIKFWGMDNEDLLYSTDAGGGLPVSPCVRFSKNGNFLAVSTEADGIKVLANAVGVLSLSFPTLRDGEVVDLDPSESTEQGGCMPLVDSGGPSTSQQSM